MTWLRVLLIFILGLLQSVNAHGQDATSSLPAIRQVWLDITQTPSVLGAGSWSIIPLNEFNKTLQRAQAVANAQRNLPWLQSARYEAELTGLELTGTVELSIYNPHAVAAWTKLHPWVLPLKAGGKTTPGQIRTQGDRNLGLLIGANQSETRKLSWGVQGEERNDGRWFSLQLPACPLATLQVTVPTPYRLDWPGHRQQLSGPFAVEGTTSRRWQLQLGGEARQEVQFVVREPFEQRLQAWTEARLDADFVVGTQQVQVRYEIDLQRWHERLRSLSMDLPAGVQVKSAVLRLLGTDTPLSWQANGPGAMSLAMPETTEQRATIVLDAVSIWKPGERLSFGLPTLRGVTSIKPTIRVVTDPAQPMVDWKWGDYYPVQSPQRDRSLESPAEVLTLAPRLVTGTQALQTPSAVQSQRVSELTYVQDAWWHLGQQSNQLLVRSAVTFGQEQPEILSWHVPEGWAVKDVTGDTATPIRTWAWHAGQPLEVQLAWSSRPVKGVTLTVRLEPRVPFVQSVDPRMMTVPMLTPVLPGRFTGCYAITLERQGVLQPVSLKVIKPLGTRAAWPADRPTLWLGFIAIVPDLCWQVQDAAAQGSVQVQDWPSTVRASLTTELQESGADHRIEYRIRLQPVAGSVKSFPIRFTSPVSGLEWKALTSGAAPAQWKAIDTERGDLSWPIELKQTCEWQASIPWSPGSPVPLISSPLAFDGVYKQGTAWHAPQGMEEVEPVGRQWRYDDKSTSPVPVRQRTTLVQLIDPMVTTKINGNIAESEYQARVEAHADPVTIRFPVEAQVIEVEIQGKARALSQEVVLGATDKDEIVRVRYRSRVISRLGLAAWQPVMPEWNVEAAPTPRQRIVRDQPVVDVWGVAQDSGELSDRAVLPGMNVVVWMSRQTFVATAILLGLLSWWSARSIKLVWILIAMMTIYLCALMVSSNWWVLIVAVGIGVFMANRGAWLKRLPRPAVGSVLLLLVIVSSDALAQNERAFELVYLIPGEKGQPASTRVMVNATLWKQMQTLAKANSAGSHQRWWISEGQTEGKLVGQRLRLSSTWNVTTEGDELVELPWPMEHAPESVRVDDVPVQAQLAGGAFGWRQFAIPVHKAGHHSVRIEWDAPIRFNQTESQAQLKLPGAPMQSLRIETVPAGMQLSGSSGAWRLEEQGQSSTLVAEVGFARNITLSWSSSSKESAKSTVDAGVLYEHRMHQTLVHAVLAYHVESGKLDQMTLELPAAWRVKNLTVVGELQAAITPRVKKWRMNALEGRQRLTVQLQRPVSGTVHLLLEMLAARQWQSRTVPLVGIDTPGVPQEHSFVAYLADCVVVKPLGTLAPVRAEEVEFARAWLPSLSSLPASAISKGRSSSDTTVNMQLLPLSGELNVRTVGEILLDAQDVTYQLQVEVADALRSVVYLQGEVDSGITITEVVGENVVRWHQSSAKGLEPSQLVIWFSTNTRQGNQARCTVRSKRPLEFGDGQTLRLPVHQIKWDGAVDTSIPLQLRSSRAGKISVQQESGLVPQTGPWAGDCIARFQVPVGVAAGASITVQEVNPALLPKVTAAWDHSSGEPRWMLTIQAAGDGRLPTLIEMNVQQGLLEQNWQFDAAMAMSVRPVRGVDANLQWNVQTGKPISKLMIRCIPLRDPSGKLVVPIVNFPAWPGLAIPAPG